MHDDATCIPDDATLRLHLGEMTAQELRTARAAYRLALTTEADKLKIAAERYMAAVACYNENPWDRVNVRKYADAKARLHELLHPQPNTQI